MLGFFSLLNALLLIPPSIAAVSRTCQIVIAFVAQVLINKNVPGVIDVLGAAFILLAAIAVTFEEQINNGVEKCCFCYCCRPQDRDITGVTQETVNLAEDFRPQAPGRIRTVSHSLS